MFSIVAISVELISLMSTEPFTLVTVLWNCRLLHTASLSGRNRNLWFDTDQHSFRFL